MKNEENSVEEWFEELRYGLEYRYQYGMEKDWSRVEALFFNGHPSNNTSGSNIIYSTGDAFLSTIHTPNPVVLVEPTRLEQIEWAPCVEQMDNDLIKQMGLPDEMEAAGLYSYLWGTSFLKIGYDSEYGWNPGLDMMGVKQPIGISMTQFSKSQRRIEYSDNMPGMPWVQACLPHDIVVPWGTKDIDRCPWVAHRVCRHIDDIKADIKYSGKKNLQPVMSMKDFVDSYQTVMKPYRIGPDLLANSTDGTGEAEYCELWEIHDKRTHKIYVIATGHDKFLRNEVDALQLRGMPFVELGFVPKGRTLWRTSDAIYLLNHQAELSDITIQARKQRRLNVLKFLYSEGAFDEAELRKLQSRDIGSMVKVKKAGGPLGDQFMAVPSSQANNTLYQEQEDVRGSARETVGFDRNSFGEYKGARTTATEVTAVQTAKQVRMTRRQSKLAKAYEDTICKVNDVCFKFWTLPKVAQVMGEIGALQWVQYVPSQLAGNYSLDIIFDDTPKDSMDSRQQQAMQVLQLSATDPTVDPLAARKFLARSFRNAAIGGVFKPGVITPLPQGQPGVSSQGGQGQTGGNSAGIRPGKGAVASRG